jgi:hypothetical protein
MADSLMDHVGGRLGLPLSDGDVVILRGHCS